MENEKKRILVIEDNEILLSTMQFVLVREGMTSYWQSPVKKPFRWFRMKPLIWS
ncbi:MULTISPECIES: response regulator [Sphingobacterium]|uniref:response regulator n=1 Tax=Sphingobacterium TaxID=28453 RepID=UPI00257CE8CB|nr:MULTISPECIES: response regulator [Sphingobacterium]